MFLEVLALFPKLSLLLLRGRNEELLAHVLVEVAIDDGRLRVLRVSILVCLRQISAVVGRFLTICDSIQLLTHLSDPIMLIQFLNHLFERWGLALLANVDAIRIDLHNLAHAKVLKLEVAALIWLTLRVLILLVEEDLVGVVDLGLT